MNVEQRKREVRINKYCLNCLARSHITADCTSDQVCQRCGWAHHTLLHAPRHVSTTAHSEEQQSRDGRIASTNGNASSRRPQRSRLDHRLGPYTRPSSHSHPRSYSRQQRYITDRATRSDDPSMSNPKQILMGALRALEYLAQTI